MIIDSFEKLSKGFSKTKNWRIILLALLFLSSFLIIGLPISLRASPYTLKVGDVTFQDIRAPRSFSYTSDILTNQAKDIAEKSVQPVFIPADPLDARRQFESLKQSIEAIEAIRFTEDLTVDQKIQRLRNDPVLFLNEDTARYSISITNAKWIQIKNESYRIFELIIRNPINSDQLENVKNTIPNFIGYAFSEKDVQLISQLITPFITINSVYSNEKTNEAVQAAREKVSPVVRTYTAGEMVVFSGQVITPTIYETLQYLGLVQQRDEPLDLLSAAFLVIGSLLVPSLYIRQARKQIIDDVSALILVSFLFIVFLLVAKLVITNHTILPFLFPIAAFGLVISSLFDYELGVIGFIPLCILVCYLLSNNLELAVYYLLTATISIFVLGKGRRLITFFMTGMGIGIVGSSVILVFRLTSGFINIEEIITLVGVTFLNGLGTMSLTLLLQNYTAVLLGRTTALQLMDLSRPDHPLLQYLLHKAPGTYQHSIQAANLAEQAARAVRADPLLARVGALYHDIGKTSNPAFFIENQVKGEIDSHEDMDQRESAKIIIRHVKEGVTLAKKYGLPPQIINFITEHHGNTIARFQYMQMLNKNASQKGKIDKKKFTYPGLPPRTRETAILMLVDGCEARARAEKPRTEFALRKMVKETIDYYIKEQQLDNVNLTLRDLKLIEDSFVYTLSNVSHKRIQYPDFKSKK